MGLLNQELIFPGGDGAGCSFEMCITADRCGCIEVFELPNDVYMLLEEKVGDCCHHIWACLRDDCGEKLRITMTCHRKIKIGCGRFRLVLLDCQTGEKVVPDDSEMLVRLTEIKA